MPWIWGIFFLVYFVSTFLGATYFFYYESSMYQYYQILIAFDIYFLIPYVLNAAAVLLNALSLIPFYGFLFKIDILSKDFWKYILLARILADLTGHAYEWKLIKSLVRYDLQVALGFVSIAVMINLTSYLALFLYAFPKKQRTSENSS